MDTEYSKPTNQMNVTCKKKKRPPPDTPISPKKIVTEDLHGKAQVKGGIVDLSPLTKSRSKDSIIF